MSIQYASMYQTVFSHPRNVCVYKYDINIHFRSASNHMSNHMEYRQIPRFPAEPRRLRREIFKPGNEPEFRFTMQ